MPSQPRGREGPGHPGLRRSFEGLNRFRQRDANNGNQFSTEPPDRGLCAGNGFVMETVNDVPRILNSQGRALTPPTDLNGFSGHPPAIDRTTGVLGPEPTDLTSAIVGTETYGASPRSERKAGNVPLRDCVITADRAPRGGVPVSPTSRAPPTRR